MKVKIKPVSVVGRVAKRPVIIYTEAKSPICIFHISLGNKFLRAAVWGKSAFTCEKFIKEKIGKSVFLEGTLENFNGEETLLVGYINIFHHEREKWEYAQCVI